MVVQRSKRPQSGASPSGAKSAEPEATPTPDLALMEHLVKQSLAVNPAMRGGRSTHEVLKALRSEAVRRVEAKREADKAGAPAPPSIEERRLNTIAFFLEQKSAEYDQDVSAITARERMLQQERAELQQRIADEIADFLALVGNGAPDTHMREALHRYRLFIGQLGVSAADIAQRVRQRKNIMG